MRCRAFVFLFVSVAHGEDRHRELPFVEAHGTLVWDQGIHGGWGSGAGARVAIPILDAFEHPGRLAFTAGAGWLYFPCPYGATGMDCPDASALWLPIGLAWSFPIHRTFSIFLEPGLGTFVAFFREACPMGTPCTHHDHVGLRPLVSLGAIVHVGPLAITVRAGFPTFSVGLGL